MNAGGGGGGGGGGGVGRGMDARGALAAEMFDHFCAAGTMKQILALHREICDTLNLKPNRLPDFYPKLKAMLCGSWKAQALFKKFDARAAHKVYGRGRACEGTRALVIGAGPCGLRAAIECQLLGAKVVVVEKRDRMSRNNVLHLWPFVIQDLRALGAKKFFGKFCAGAIDHISIRQLQCILLKVSLLLGVEIHEGVSFEELLEPTVTHNSETLGWRARVSPAEHAVSQFEFDVLIGADGKRNTLAGFKRKEFRGKLAMAITANFINRHTEQEASVPEISGVAFIFNQKFFKELYEVTGIDLENIVYYKDDTHYFVMTAKKHSLLDKGVLLKDYAEVTRLLSVENVDRDALLRYAQEAARFSTEGRLPLRDFALNHYGEPDVALFDFTSMYAAENASMVMERRGRRLLCQLVGDSLLEPFWPTGSGCARGFLSALDAAWAVRAWGRQPPPHPLHVIAERESIYRLLAQTTQENLHRDFGAYTLEPSTRYRTLNRAAVSPHRVTAFYDADEPLPLDASASTKKKRREADVCDEVLVSWVGCEESSSLRAAVSPAPLAAVVRRYRPDLLPEEAPPRTVYHVLQQQLGIGPTWTAGTSVRDASDAKVRAYLSRVYAAFKGEVPHVQHRSDEYHQIKQTLQKEKHLKNTVEHSVSAYTTAAETDRSHSSSKRKRRAPRPQQVSTVERDPADSLRRRIDRLDIDDISRLARLIEGHDEPEEPAAHRQRQAEIREQIMALLDPGVTDKVAQYFQQEKDTPAKPTRRLKGLHPAPVREPSLDGGEEESASGRGWRARSADGAEVPRGSPEPGQRTRAASLTDQMATRLRRVTDMLEGNRRASIAGPAHVESIGDRELEARRRRIAQSMQSTPPRHGGGRRGATREITKLRFDKSMRLLSGMGLEVGSPAAPAATSDELQHDPGLQQYRAAAPAFALRVRNLERQLQHYEEGRAVGGGGRASGGGALVARLAAELAGGGSAPLAPSAPPAPTTGKPKDLMRSVGKIERDDWNMKVIERKIQEHRLGRPSPRTAERVPKWDREQFLGRQRRLRGEAEAGAGAERWGAVDDTLQRLELRLRDSGRPHHGTNKVADLATKFVKKDDPEPKIQPKEEQRRGGWSGGSGVAGVGCAACGARVFAAEGVTADGRHYHRACFRCALCRAALRPGNYVMERFGGRLVCCRHTGVGAGAGVEAGAGAGAGELAGETAAVGAGEGATPERISVEVSDSGAREIDEDEWTDLNCLASETSAAGALSEEEESSSSEEYTDAGESEGEARRSPVPAHHHTPPAHHRHHMYFSDDSFGYDDYSDDGGESSGNESCSRMREAREARRREVPAEARAPPPGSSEVESEEEEESDSSEEVSSGTEVSTDSEFGREESAPPAPPAILVTEAPAAVAAPVVAAPAAAREYPLSRARSAGGLATKRALELKRRYLLGEPVPPAVRNSHSTSHIDTKFEAVRSNITQFQKMLNPASGAPQKPIITYQQATEDKKSQPMPDIIKNLCTTAPVDLLTKTESSLREGHISEKSEPASEGKEPEPEVESQSEEEEEEEEERGERVAVPRVEVHDEGGALIQLDSLVVGGTEQSSSSESGRDATTLALTDTELSDWAAESGVLDDRAHEDRTRARPPRALPPPKSLPAQPAQGKHVCGRDTPPVLFSDALEHFEFADEGEQDPSIETYPTPKNEGYMELVDDDFEYSPNNDRSINFIERSFSETVLRSPAPDRDSYTQIVHTIPTEIDDAHCDGDVPSSPPNTGNESSEKSISEPTANGKSDGKTDESKAETNGKEPSVESLTITEVSPASNPASSPSLGLDESARSSEAGRARRERDQQTEVVRRLVLERLGERPRRAARRPRVAPLAAVPPPVPPPPRTPSPPPRPAPPHSPLPVTPSFSDPELARETRGKSIMKSISDYLNRHLHPRHKEGSERVACVAQRGALQEPPPVPPPPVCYTPPTDTDTGPVCGSAPPPSTEEVVSRRLARLHRRLARPLSAEQQAATVAELVQVSAQRDAHRALMDAHRRRSAASGGD